MARKVHAVKFLPSQPKLLRVAAYARVSAGKDAMLNSLSAQVSHYSEYIQKNPGWVYCGVYSDAAKTGTTENRDGFQQLITRCRAGEIDLIITKSISRFARNTVTVLEMVRELGALGVDVYFERENIHSRSGDGEMMLSILASFAQEESKSASENQLWRVQKNFKEGKAWNCTMLGYRNVDGQLEVVPDEAEVVRTIFNMYLDGAGAGAIATHLNACDLCGRRGNKWHEKTVFRVLRNYAYTGNLMLQQTYSEDYITKKRMPNEGQYPMYHVEQAHEPLVDLSVFQAVQEEIAKRAAKRAVCTEYTRLPFNSLAVCEQCGGHYKRRLSHGRPFWICGTRVSRGKGACGSKMVPEAELVEITRTTVGALECVNDLLDEITIGEGNRLMFRYKDGREVQRTWQDHTRADSWTAEMREEARNRCVERRKKIG